MLLLAFLCSIQFSFSLLETENTMIKEILSLILLIFLCLFLICMGYKIQNISTSGPQSWLNNFLVWISFVSVVSGFIFASSNFYPMVDGNYYLLYLVYFFKLYIII